MNNPGARPRWFRRHGFAWQLPLFLLAWCVIVELFVRAALTSPSSIVDDPMLGWRWLPNSTSLQITSDAGSQIVHFNSLGLNDEDVDTTGPKKRIAVLGDSYVEALQVPRRKNFIHIIEHDLPAFRLIDAGRAGLDPANELVMLDSLAAKLTPEGVIDVVNGGDESDLLNDGISVKHCGPAGRVCDYRLPPVPPDAARRMLKPMMQRSALFTYLLRKYKDIAAQEINGVRTSLARVLPHHPASAPRQTGWDALAPSDIEGVLEIVFAKMKHDGPLIVVFVPQFEYAKNGQPHVSDSAAFIAEVAQAARANQSTFLDTRTALAAAYARSGQPPHGFDYTTIGRGHLNEQGHRAVAKALEPLLTKFPDHP